MAIDIESLNTSFINNISTTAEDEKLIRTLKIQSEAVEITVGTEKKNIKFNIDSESSSPIGDGKVGKDDTLEIKLRLVDYCDASGNKGQIVVLASQLFTPGDGNE